MNDARFKNQSGIIGPAELSIPVYLIGAGSIGSFTALTLAKMGFNDITVQDMDTIEVHNISNQFYPLDSEGEHKIDVLKEMVKEMSGFNIKTEGDKWDSASNLPPGVEVLVVAVDDMDLRKEIWDTWGKKVPHFIEARMGAEVAIVYAVDTNNKAECELYESTLYPQSEALQERCAAKSIIYTVLGCASIIAGLVKRTALVQSRPTEVAYDFVTFTSTSFKARAKEVAEPVALSV